MERVLESLRRPVDEYVGTYRFVPESETWTRSEERRKCNSILLDDRCYARFAAREWHLGDGQTSDDSPSVSSEEQYDEVSASEVSAASSPASSPGQSARQSPLQSNSALRRRHSTGGGLSDRFAHLCNFSVQKDCDKTSVQRL